jgi:DMSO/TMAO reductase YedYZ molybdopterin-dependent catalytic subunit
MVDVQASRHSRRAAGRHGNGPTDTQPIMRQLPPGQRKVEGFPRLGGPSKPPLVPAEPALEITGAVREPFTVALFELSTLPRTQQTCDFRCVAGWSAIGLHWEGVGLRATPVTHVVFCGLDRYRAIVSIEDALQNDVLLADRLDDEPLSLEHGAPLRLLSPHSTATSAPNTYARSRFTPALHRDRMATFSSASIPAPASGERNATACSRPRSYGPSIGPSSGHSCGGPVTAGTSPPAGCTESVTWRVDRSTLRDSLPAAAIDAPGDLRHPRGRGRLPGGRPDRLPAGLLEERPPPHKPLRLNRLIIRRCNAGPAATELWVPTRAWAVRALRCRRSRAAHLDRAHARSSLGNGALPRVGSVLGFRHI